jgi:hypothetical protein
MAAAIRKTGFFILKGSKFNFWEHDMALAYSQYSCVPQTLPNGAFGAICSL